MLIYLLTLVNCLYKLFVINVLEANFVKNVKRSFPAIRYMVNF